MKREMKQMKKQKGIGLIEIMLGLIVISVVIGLGINAYRQADQGSKALVLQNQVLQLQAGVKAISRGPNFNGLTGNLLIQSGRAPSDMVSGSGATATLVNDYGSAVTVTAQNYDGGTDNSYRVTYNGVPTGECVESVMNLAENFLSVDVAGTLVKDRATSVTLSQATVVTQCNTGDAVTIFFQGS